MSRIGIAIRAVLVALALAAPVLADAPIGGKDQQYANFIGEDRFITDRHTHLKWDRPLAPYPAALSFIDAQASCSGAKRLPSLKELLTLVDETPHDEYDEGVLVARAIDRSAFSDTPPEEFWTSSLSGAKVWVVDFSDGTTDAVTTTNKMARVRCVQSVP